MMFEPNVQIRYIGGNCPVQAEGEIGEKEFYFRARGQHWSLSIGGADRIASPEFYHKEEWGQSQFDAGWMPIGVALQMIGKGIDIYLKSIPND